MSRFVRMPLFFLALAVLWGTLVATPFRVFAQAVRDLVYAGTGAVGLDGTPRVLVLAIVLLALLCGLLLLGRTRHAELVAGSCALAGTLWHMGARIGDRTFTGETAAMLIGLALLLILLLLKLRIGSVRLGEAFALSPGVLLVMETAVLPQMERWGVQMDTLPGWTILPDLTLFSSDWNVGIPFWVAGIVIAVVTVVLMLVSAAPSETGKHG